MFGFFFYHPFIELLILEIYLEEGWIRQHLTLCLMMCKDMFFGIEMQKYVLFV